MTITLVLPQSPGYSETFFRSKIKGLHESGHKVILVTASTKHKFEVCKHLQHPKVSKNNFIQVFRMLLVFIGLLPYVKRIIKFIQLERKEETSFKKILEKIYINATLLKLKSDWIHFGFATMAIERELVAKAIGAKLAVSFRGYDIDVFPLKNPDCYNRLWSNFDKIHSISKYLLNKAHEIGLPKKIKAEIIHPAVDLEKINKNIRKIDFSSNKVQILTIARLHWVKGIDDLIETAYYLKEMGVDFEWRIIGSGDQKHTERYKFHVYQRGLVEEVKFLGKLSHKETLAQLNRSEMYVQTSLSEGFCNAVLEAQVIGKLCIAFDAGALDENIVDQKTGWLVPKGSPKLLANKIQEIITLSETEKEKISRNAIQRVKKEFNLEKQKLEFNEFYKQLKS